MKDASSLRTMLSNPKRRRSKLNSVFDASSAKKHVQIRKPNPQESSMFLSCLPVEIRLIIYQYVFGPSLIHVVDMGCRLAHVRCLQWQVGEVWDGHQHGDDGFDDYTILDKSEDPNDQLLALCLSCRLMCVT